MMRLFTRMLVCGWLSLAICSLKTLAQTAKPEVLTNKAVIDIAKAGLGNDIIISKIGSSACKFDVSTTGLIDLKKQGVSPEIISAMLNKTSGKAAGETPAHAVSPAPAPVKKPSLPVITQLNLVHYYDKGVVLPLEKVTGKSDTKKAGFGGFKGSDMLLEISGASSPVKLGAGMADSFVVNTGNNTVPDLVLFKLKADKSKRSAVVGKLTTKGPKSGDEPLTLEMTKLADGLFGIKPPKLEKGEYYFTAKPNINLSTSSIDVYAFAVQ